MLTKRTNILFDQETWEYLVGISAKRNVSVGELVREAVKIHHIDNEDKIAKQRAKAFDKINSIRSEIKHKFTLKEIRDSIKDGRKY